MPTIFKRKNQFTIDFVTLHDGPSSSSAIAKVKYSIIFLDSFGINLILYLNHMVGKYHASQTACRKSCKIIINAADLQSAVIIVFTVTEFTLFILDNAILKCI